jgi:hypothetical protein
VVRRNGVLREIYLNDDFVEVEGDPQPGVDAPVGEGNLADISIDAKQWIGRIATSLKGGFPSGDRLWVSRSRVLCPSARHADVLLASSVVGDPYVRIGEQDITAHVNFSDLIEAGRAAAS